MNESMESRRILEGLKKARVQIEKLKRPASQRVAIIGMAGRFPGAEDVNEFWELLRKGESGVRDLKDEELAVLGAEAKADDYVKRYASFADPTAFDAGFFGYSPGEAEVLDPQHRVFLECAWTALEDAAYDSHQTQDRIGVYAGAALNTYLVNLHSNPDLRESVNEVQAVVSNVMGLMPTRVSYHLDLRGPSCGIQTGCSTSLVSLHEACRAILDGDCEIALAGGVTIGRAKPEGYVYEPGGIFSPDGCCRAFDAKGKGTLFGNGVGVVVLKRYEDALRDGDAIRAVVLGTAINNDGADKVGLLAPSVAGQAEVIKKALERANVLPETVSYVEGHGTATELGDPVEFAALNQAMGAALSEAGVRCFLGSVKSNVGHLDAAAGVSGLIKTVLAMENEALPPNLYFTDPNPQIDLAKGAFQVLSKLSSWLRGAEPRRAGVSSFGMGGTNAHAVLEEAPMVVREKSSRESWVFPISAKSNLALSKRRKDLVQFLKSRDESLADLAFTLQVGRRAMPHRQAVVANTREELLRKLQKDQIHEVNDARPVVFLFSGQGSQYPGMGKKLYETEAIFREALNDCAAEFSDLDLIALVTNLEESLSDTAEVQPALFALEYSLARLLMSWNVKPAAMIGHSLGEYVAACLAGVFSLKDALHLVRRRGVLMQACPNGRMLAVRAQVDELLELLGQDLEIAAVNAPDQTVISGTEVEISKLQEQLAEKEISCLALQTSHAFHSKSMDPALADFRETLERIELNAPELDLVSNQSGKWLTASEATSVDYWVGHLRHSVLFHEGLRTLSENLPEACYLEIGPGQALCRFAASSIEGAIVVPSLPGLIEAQASLWISGVSLNWAAIHDEKRNRLRLPTYPFDRRSYHISLEVGEQKTQRSSESWFSIPSWQQRPLMSAEAEAGRCLVILGIPQWKDALDDFETIYVESGDRWLQEGKRFKLRSDSKDDFLRLIDILGDKPSRWIYAWKKENDLASLVALTQAFQAAPCEETRFLDVVTDGLFSIGGAISERRQRSALPGLLKVLPQEVPNLECRLLDGSGDFANHLVHEWHHFSEQKVVAYRGRDRWVQEYQEVDLPVQETPFTKKGGTYLVIGDLVDGLGLVYAKALREELGAKVIVLGREEIPDPLDWDIWLASHGGQHPLSQTVKRIKALGREGEDFVMASVSLSDSDAVLSLVQDLRVRLGDDPLSGLFYADVMGGEASCALSELSELEREQIYDKKVRQLDSVMGVVEQENPKRVVLQSTLSAIVGGSGFAAYAASGSYLDGLAARSEHPAIVAINWDVCRLEKEEVQDDSLLMASSFSPEEVWEATRRILAQPHLRQVIVSRRSLDDLEFAFEERTRNISTEGGQDYEEPRTDIEIVVAKSMGDLLGIPRIGLNDDFFALGGHSLLAIQAVTKLRKKFGVEVPMRTILQGTPTVAGIAKVIEESMSQIDEEQISLVEGLLEEIEGEPK